MERENFNLSEEDSDFNYNSTIASESVDEASEIAPKPATSTTSFKMVIIGGLVTGILSLLTAKGFIIPAQAETAQAILQTALLAGYAWLVQTFVKYRGQVSVAKTETEGRLALAAASTPNVISGTVAELEPLEDSVARLHTLVYALETMKGTKNSRLRKAVEKAIEDSL